MIKGFRGGSTLKPGWSQDHLDMEIFFKKKLSFCSLKLYTKNKL